jgi:polar amino acid transport system substrate-binding protein
VTLGETHEEWARAQGYRSAPTRACPSLLLELQNGRVDAIVNDSIAAILAMGEGRASTCRSSTIFETDEFGAGIAIREGNPALAAAMQEALDEMMEDGTYLEIAEEWVGGDIR